MVEPFASRILEDEMTLKRVFGPYTILEIIIGYIYIYTYLDIWYILAIYHICHYNGKYSMFWLYWVLIGYGIWHQFYGSLGP